MKKTIFVITSIFLMVSCVEKTQKSENKTSKKEIEPQNNSISVFDTKIKYPPFLEETSFDYFNSAENDTVSEIKNQVKLSNQQIKNLEIKNYFNDSSHVYLNYEIPFSKNFKTFVFSYFENENELKTLAMTFDKNFKKIDQLLIAYDEIAESWLKTKSKIFENKIEINHFDESSGEIEITTEFYELDGQGKFIKIEEN
jgi:hypothetical protein